TALYGAEAAQELRDVETDEPIIAVRVREQIRHHRFCGHLVEQSKHRDTPILVSASAHFQEGFRTQCLLVSRENLDQCGLRGRWVGKQFGQAMRIIASTV